MNISIAAAGMILGILLSTAYGAGFHLLVGGPVRHLLLYLAAAWVGFVCGHFVGDYLDIVAIQLGVVRLLPASLGAWLGLILSRWLVQNEA